MSRVMLIAADRELPLRDHQEMRTSTVMVEGKAHTISCPRGFMISEHSYYRSCVDELGHSMRPYQYELDLEVCQDDLSALKAYLTEHFAPGEEVELWNLWVGIDQSGYLPHYRGSLADFDMETLEQFDCPPIHNGAPGQCRMTITI